MDKEIADEHSWEAFQKNSIEETNSSRGDGFSPYKPFTHRSSLPKNDILQKFFIRRPVPGTGTYAQKGYSLTASPLLISQSIHSSVLSHSQLTFLE